MKTLRNTIDQYITADLEITKVVFEAEVNGKRKEFSIPSPKKGKELFLGIEDLVKYADYVCKDVFTEGDDDSKKVVLNLGFIYPQVGRLDCDMCDATGVVTEGEHDDIRDVPCPCTIDEPADMSGATEGDR